MPATSLDYFTKIAQPGAATSLAAPGHTIGGTSISVDSTSLWVTTTGVIFAIDTVTIGTGGAEVRDANSYTVWEAVVSSATTITTMRLLYGSDQNYPAGSTTRVYQLPTASRENRMVDGLLVEHNETGTHGAITATSVAATGAVTGASFNTTSPNGINQAALPLGAVVQVVTAQFSAVATGTTLVPLDDTIPQITEGNEYMTLAITPKTTTNILVIEAVTMLSSSAVSEFVTVALFQDATANALAAVNAIMTAADTTLSTPLSYSMAAGTTSSTTFRIRAGANGAATTTFNGRAGARLFGAIPKSFIKITEYKA